MKTIVQQPLVKKEKSFPKLMISEETGMIILATKEGNHITGTVLHLGNSELTKLGERSELWKSIFFKDYEGVLALSND